MLRMPLQILRCRSMGAIISLNSKSFKNFGHKKQPVPTVTVLWHGYLTFMFIGLCVNWKRVGSFIFGEKAEQPTSTE